MRFPGQVIVTTFVDLPVSFPRVIETSREISASPFDNGLPFFTSPIFTGLVFGASTVTWDFADDFVVLGVELADEAPTTESNARTPAQTLTGNTRRPLDRGTPTSQWEKRPTGNRAANATVTPNRRA